VSLSGTLSRYIARVYVVWFLAVALALLGIAYLAETMELLRRTAENPEVGLVQVMVMALVKAPATTLEALPFIVLVASMGAFWQLNRFNEVVVARASGVSAWQFLRPALVTILVIGGLRVMVLDSFAAAGMARYIAFEHRYLDTTSALVAATANGLWIRQAEPNGHSIVHAEDVSVRRGVLRQVSIFSFGEEDHFIGRIDARRALLSDGYWDLEKVWITEPRAASRQQESYRLPTSLSFEQISESFAPAGTISFWELPRYIAALESTGFSASGHVLQLHRLYSQPLQLLGMVLLAGAFSLRHQRNNDTLLLIGAGGVSGFLLYFLSYFVFKLGLGASVPLVLAAWTPAVIGALLGGALLLHLEDG
jgi:lipopolysaccharide export system permease protein